MNIKEQLIWILDKKDNIYSDKNIKENIDFVHSLGKKCDSVGWSELDLNEPDAYDVLEKIKAFCEERGFSARGWYERSYEDFESDWFELKIKEFGNETVLDKVKIKAQTGEEIYLDVISAYRETEISPKGFWRVAVPDRFRKVCVEKGISGIDFCWVKDKGRYEAEQYFYIFPEKRIPRIAFDRYLTKEKEECIQALGGFLPKIASVFHKLENIQLQDCYLKEDMPSGGLTYAFCHDTYDFCGRYKILIHKDTARILMDEKVISMKDLTPARIVDRCPEGYFLEETEEAPIPVKEFIDRAFSEYEGLKEKSRPEYIVKEKEALKLLRKKRAERPSDFNKRISKKLSEEMSDSVYNSLLPFYQISDGAFLSDEYTFLKFNESVKVTKEFFSELKKEELLEEMPDGVVIAVSADGDNILYLKDGSVIRFSHEAPEIICRWFSPAMFFVDAINNSV